MKKISVFNHVTLDGYFAGVNGEIDWFKSLKKDIVWEEYSHTQARSGNTLILGRTTYDLMKSYWTSDDAIRHDRDTADAINSGPKIVFSKTIDFIEEEPNWENVRLRHKIDVDEILQIKEEEDITILGSGSIVQQFAHLNLIDEYHLIVVPVSLGKGKRIFKDIEKMELDLLEARSFKNGLVLLRYQPPVSSLLSVALPQFDLKPDKQPYIE
jgi:dihydrofolate reductase